MGTQSINLVQAHEYLKIQNCCTKNNWRNVKMLISNVEFWKWKDTKKWEQWQIEHWAPVRKDFESQQFSNRLWDNKELIQTTLLRKTWGKIKINKYFNFKLYFLNFVALFTHLHPTCFSSTCSAQRKKGDGHSLEVLLQKELSNCGGKSILSWSPFLYGTIKPTIQCLIRISQVLFFCS